MAAGRLQRYWHRGAEAVTYGRQVLGGEGDVHAERMRTQALIGWRASQAWIVSGERQELPPSSFEPLSAAHLESRVNGSDLYAICRGDCEVYAGVGYWIGAGPGHAVCIMEMLLRYEDGGGRISGHALEGLALLLDALHRLAHWRGAPTDLWFEPGGEFPAHLLRHLDFEWTGGNGRPPYRRTDRKTRGRGEAVAKAIYAGSKRFSSIG